MITNLSPKELLLLTSLAEYRVLSAGQISALGLASRQMARRRIGDLMKSGHIGVAHQPFRGLAGRPENVVFLRTAGVELLKNRGELDRKVPNDVLTRVDFRTLGHQLLINWFRIHLNLISQHQTNLVINYLSPTHHHDRYSRSFTDPGPVAGVIPDGIFSISETNSGKSLLFFLEVDMATETLSSRNSQTKDIQKKIQTYQHMFANSGYGELEEVLAAKFKGLRTLFVTPSKSRLDQLCRLVRSIPNADFIWLTDSDAIFQKGVSATIWIRGGNPETGSHSVLGPALQFDCPLPSPG